MIRKLLGILFVAPLCAVASDSHLYSGVDFTATKIKEKSYSADALLTFGLKAAVDRHNSFILEAGIQEQDEVKGALLKGNALYRRNLFDNREYIPYVASGISRIFLTEQKCGYVLETTAPVPTYAYQCTQDYINSNGVTVELGLNIRLAHKRYFIVKVSSFKGSGETKMNLIGIGGTF